MNLKLASGDTLKAVLAEAITTSNPHALVEGRNNAGRFNQWTALNGVDPVTLYTGPERGDPVVDRITVVNRDTASATLTLTNVVNGTAYTLAALTLQSGETLQIGPNGLQVLDNSGNVKLAFASSATTFTGDITLADGKNIILDSITGSKIGATGDKIAFLGATPVVQRDAYTQTYATADRTIAAPTAAALTVADGAGTNNGTIEAITADASVIAAIQELAAQINKLVADGADTKQAVNSLIDDLQALGFAG